MYVSEEIVFLEQAFDILNQKYFESALTRPAITIQSAPRSHGHFTPFDTWDDSGKKLKEINLSAESLCRPVVNTIATLIHEMVHYWCHANEIKDTSRNNIYHNKRFREEAEKRGLIITDVPGIGFSETAPSPELRAYVTHMGWDNKLQLYRNTREEILVGIAAHGDDAGDGSQTQQKKKTSTRKYICPVCGLSIRATKDVRIACMDCGNVQMIVSTEHT